MCSLASALASDSCGGRSERPCAHGCCLSLPSNGAQRAEGPVGVSDSRCVGGDTGPGRPGVRKTWVWAPARTLSLCDLEQGASPLCASVSSPITSGYLSPPASTKPSCPAYRTDGRTDWVLGTPHFQDRQWLPLALTAKCNLLSFFKEFLIDFWRERKGGRERERKKASK